MNGAELVRGPASPFECQDRDDRGESSGGGRRADPVVLAASTCPPLSPPSPLPSLPLLFLPLEPFASRNAPITTARLPSSS